MTELLVKTSTQAEQWITKIEFEKETVRRLMEEMRGERQALHRHKEEIQVYKKELQEEREKMEKEKAELQKYKKLIRE